ncbi:MAG TPA: fluoride efflux transporter CrcB [Chitinophagaceae bacterium]|nr:fluoride efflux transporter CrcB [Chitinophagaceae bacterium]
MIKNLLLIGLGGGLGSMARYLCQKWFMDHYPHSYPWGTFVVNITGCFLIGLLWGITFKSFAENESWKLFLMTGLCGGFTTFSAFTLEGIGLIKEHKPGLFLLYIGGSVLIGLLATYTGMKISRA